MTQTRKPRRKVTTDLGKSIMQRERQRLIREQADLSQRMAEEAQNARQAALQQAIDSTRNPNKNIDRALQRSVVKRIAGVLASEGVTPSIEVTPIPDHARINAWTDFSKIYVGYHVYPDMKLTAAILRGLFYHEGGHIRWTVPYLDLVEQAKQIGWNGDDRGLSERDLHRAWNSLEDQRMETAVTTDSPRKAGYFTPTILGELCSTVDDAAANWPLLVWRKYLPAKVVAGARRLFVVRNNEPVAKLIEAIVGRYVTASDAKTMMEAVVEMAVAFQSITPVTYNLDDAGHKRQQRRTRKFDPNALSIPIPPQGGCGDDEAEDEGDDPQSLDDLSEAQVEHIMEVLSQCLMHPETLLAIQYVVESESDEASDGQGGGGGGQPSKSKDSKGKGDSKDKDSKDDKGGKSDSKDKDDEYLDEKSDADDAEGEGGDGEDEQAPEGGGSQQVGGTSGSHSKNEQAADSGEPLKQDDLDEAIKDAEASRLNDSTLDADMDAFAEAQDNAASKLEPYRAGRHTDPLLIAAAENLGEGLYNSFQALTVDKAPDWHEQQRRGILNVNRYITRQPGDVEFFRGYVDNGAPACDIAVSLLLDYSGSMGGSLQELSMVAYGCKVACTRLNVPCTVSLWDTDAQVLFDAAEKVDGVPTISARGGTNPTIALNDLVNQRFGKPKHLVLVMTDDAWGAGSPSFSTYQEEGRIIIGLGYTNGSYESHMAESMKNRGADDAYSIANLAEIPRYLEQTLARMA